MRFNRKRGCDAAEARRIAKILDATTAEISATDSLGA